jgi:hypothetical protein
VFIDGDHSYEGVRRDLLSWWPKIAKNGFIGGHDYAHPKPRWGVKKAVDEFFNGLGLEVQRDVDLTWFVWKINPLPEHSDADY